MDSSRSKCVTAGWPSKVSLQRRTDSWRLGTPTKNAEDNPLRGSRVQSGALGLGIFSGILPSFCQTSCVPGLLRSQSASNFPPLFFWLSLVNHVRPQSPQRRGNTPGVCMRVGQVLAVDLGVVEMDMPNQSCLAQAHIKQVSLLRRSQGFETKTAKGLLIAGARLLFWTQPSARVWGV